MQNNNQEIIRLEQLVETLISRFREQKSKLQALEKKLRDQEEECELLKLEIDELQKQRSETASRVSGLLGRIEDWETEFTPSSGLSKGKPDKKDDSPPEDSGSMLAIT
jgi:chromosome segregation ATPase